MSKLELILVLKKLLENQDDLDDHERQVIKAFLKEAENKSLSVNDILGFTKNFFDIIKLIQSILE